MKEISQKSDDNFIKDIINELEHPSTHTYVEGMPVDANKKPESRKVQISFVFGALGIIFAWIFPVIGHIVSILGIVIGNKEGKETGKNIGLYVSIIGELFAILSSLVNFLSAT